jgi:hypothetical protein
VQAVDAAAAAKVARAVVDPKEPFEVYAELSILYQTTAAEGRGEAKEPATRVAVVAETELAGFAQK